MPIALPRIKIVLFYAIMCALVAMPILAGVVMLTVSVIGYNILQHPERHQSTGRIWNIIATNLYYQYQAELWQNRLDCVQYDRKLLYKPSSGCHFANKEFSTDLSFSEDGRSVKSSQSFASGRPLFFVGDSETMGWGVNDDETFASIIASKVEVPVFNLGVASYGTVRELIRLRMHARFQATACILIQYSWNDFDENEVYLARGSLPFPTPERFRMLVSDYGRRKISFLDVLLQAFDFMFANPVSFFASVLGAHEFPLEDDDRMNSSGAPRKESEDVEAFLAVLASFADLIDKKVFVMGPSRFISALNRGTRPANVLPISVALKYEDWYTLDMHPNAKGHREIAAQILEQLKRSEQGRLCLGRK